MKIFEDRKELQEKKKAGKVRKICKLLLPPMLALLVVTGYGSTAMQTLARTITTITRVQVPTMTEVVETTTVDQSSAGPSGDGWIYVTEAGFYEFYKRTTFTPTLTWEDREVTVELADKLVPEEVPQTADNNYGLFLKDIMRQIREAMEAEDKNAPIILNTGDWISFTGSVYELLQESNRPVQITFIYQAERYRVDIPAGADYMSLVDENGYCGFLNLMAHFGGTKIQ